MGGYSNHIVGWWTSAGRGYSIGISGVGGASRSVYVLPSKAHE